MEFEWDAIKAESNLIKHGVSFEFAVNAFFDKKRVVFEDDRKDYKEKRCNLFGKAEGRFLVVSFTLRGGKTRIISARKGNSREKRKYSKF